jgi:putative Ig domain-containing protein
VSLQTPSPALRLGAALLLGGCALLLADCGGGSSAPAPATNPSPPPPAALSITTTALANGQVGVAYSATLAASGGTSPYKWSLSSGTLPAGLTLSAAGLLSGTPGAAAAAMPLTFTVTDSAGSAQTDSATLKLTISAASITVSISPARAGVTVGQALSLSATTSDNGGVSWSTTPAGGSFSSTTSVSGAALTYTAAAVAGVYTLTATSLTDKSVSGSIAVGVTDLAGVYTYHNDLARDGANTREYALTPADVATASFGKLFSCSVDGAIYAAPLWVANLTVNGSSRNVVFVATQHDSVYAFDADAAPCQQLWTVSLIDAAHGASGTETSVPSGVSGYLVGEGPGADIAPEVGVTGTPVIDPTTNILYVVSKSAAGTSVYQRLHAIDLASGSEKAGSPVTISATYPGSGDGGSSVSFNPGPQNQRAALALANGTVYIAWGSHDDVPRWYGWLIGYSYNGSAFAQSAAFVSTPNAGEGGIWMSGGGPSFDNAGHLYVITGNGAFDATSGTAPNNDYGDSFLQLTAALAVSSWFTPTDQAADYANDNDFGSGGSAMVLNQAVGSPAHLVAGGGKDGTLYLLNGDALGGSGDTLARQYLSLGHAIFGSAAFWNGTLYINPVGGPMLAYTLNSATLLLNTTPSAQAPTNFGFPGASPVVSASGAASNGIVWILDGTNFCTGTAPACGPTVLHAYSAANLAQELWNSSKVSADAAGNAVQFAVPTVANGKVYVGTRGNNSGGVSGSTSVAGELEVYGLKPN